jgi:hypothetical protein
MLEFIVLILYFMRLHSLKHEKRKKNILNSKWRQNPRLHHFECLKKVYFFKNLEIPKQKERKKAF